MDNVTVEMKGNSLILTSDLTKNFGASSSGKTEIVASTRGGVALAGKDGYFVNISIYRKAAPAAK